MTLKKLKAMKKIFKPGDRVRLRSGSPIMVVQKYAREYSPWIGWYESSIIVECTWFDAEGYKRKNFHQNNLIKATSNYLKNNSLDTRKSGQFQK